MSGYACAGEFEMKTTGVANAGNSYCIMLDSNISTTSSECQAFIAIQDFGSVATNNFLYGLGMSPATNDGSKIFSTCSTGKTHTHSLRIRIGATPYWIMCTSTTPS